MMLVRWVTEPDDAMNYGFLAKCYLALTVISAAFFAAQVWGVTAVAGFWIVPAPAFPAMFYALWLDWVATSRKSVTRVADASAAPAAAPAVVAAKVKKTQ